MPAPVRPGAEVRSEPRGPHWIAWIEDENGKPAGSVVLVAQTKDEAEKRARRWAERLAASMATP
jgi:hypothetical protein